MGRARSRGQAEGRVGRLGSAEIEDVFRRGRALTTGLFVIRHLEGEGPARLAVVAGRRLGGAVRRNRMRRRLREVARLGPPLRPGLRAVVVARAPVAVCSYGDLVRAWREAVNRAGLSG